MVCSSATNGTTLPVVICEAFCVIKPAERHLQRLVDVDRGRVAIGHLQVSSTTAFKVDDAHHSRRISVGVQVIKSESEQRCRLIGEPDAFELIFCSAAYANDLMGILDLSAVEAAITV